MDLSSISTLQDAPGYHRQEWESHLYLYLHCVRVLANVILLLLIVHLIAILPLRFPGLGMMRARATWLVMYGAVPPLIRHKHALLRSTLLDPSIPRQAIG